MQVHVDVKVTISQNQWQVLATQGRKQLESWTLTQINRLTSLSLCRRLEALSHTQGLALCVVLYVTQGDCFLVRDFYQELVQRLPETVLVVRVELVHQGPEARRDLWKRAMKDLETLEVQS